MSRLFTLEQKQSRKDILTDCLAMFLINKAKFLCRFIYMDQIWVYHFITDMKESKQNRELKD